MNGSIRSGKNVVKLAILAWIALAGVIGAGASARWFGAISRSEEANEIFNAAATLPPELLEAVEWQPDRPDLLRSIDPLTRLDVTSSWIRAWEQLSIVAQTGDLTGLEVYFSNSALEALLASQEATAGLPVHQIGHQLRIDFFSRDGQVIGLAADEVRLVRARQVDGVVGWLQAVESYEAILVLDDGNWRIHHWVRGDGDFRWWTDPVLPGRDDLTSSDDGGGAAMIVNGINYYPRESPFDAFWPNYDREIVAGDLDRVVDAGLDSIRIFLPFDQLGGRWTTAEDLEPVVDLLDLAHQRGLGVVVTMFDGRTDHRTDRWDSDAHHLIAVAASLANHPALLMWDIKNEPDRDIGANGVGEQLLYAWLGFVAHELRAADPVTPMTVGWSTPLAALAAPVQTDVVSFHAYGPIEELTLQLPKLVAHAEQRPVLITEYGLPTWDSAFPGGHTEAEQARYLADVINAATEAGLDGAMAWTLWDLAVAPPDAGRMPWRTGPQTSLGLLRADGSAKPALAVVGRNGNVDLVDGIGPLHRLHLRFWRLVVALTGSVVGLWFIGRRLWPHLAMIDRTRWAKYYRRPARGPIPSGPRNWRGRSRFARWRRRTPR